MPFIKQNDIKKWNNEFLNMQYRYFLEYKQFYDEQFKKNVEQIDEIDKQICQLKENEQTTHQVFMPGGMSDYDDEKIEELIKQKSDLLKLNAELQKKVEFNEESQIFFCEILDAFKNDGCMKSRDQENLGLETLEIQEIERKRIARDLHDSTIQSLTALTHKIELCSTIMELDGIRAKLELQTINHNIHNIISDMRRIIYNLRPMSFDDMGMDETIDRFLARLEESSGIKINYCVNGMCPSFKSVVSLSLFRIIQEACNNAVKHAKASTIDICIHYEKDNVRLLICDDGIGFIVDELIVQCKNNVEEKFGLSTIYERVYLLNGEIQIKSDKENGTRISIRVPINKEICND